jgi:glycosyltransferase involved in cell wall biosynthesis
MPMFSVVIPLYNKERTVERAVRSVLNQTVQDFEIVVVNDGSEDQGPAIVGAIIDPRIRLIYQENQGVSAARNRGVAESKADLIAFLDADDLWAPDFLEEIAALCDAYPDCGLFATRYAFCLGDDKWPAIVRLESSLDGGDRGLLKDYFKVASVSHPPVWSSAACVRRKAFLSIGGFPFGVASGEDLLTWARLAVRYPVAYSMKPLSFFHLGDSAAGPWKLRRVPGKENYVGQSLQALLAVCPSYQRTGLRRYVAHWYKMRTSIYLRVPDRRLAFAAWLQSMRFHPFQPKLIAYLGLMVLPVRIASTFIDRNMRLS